VNEPTKADSQRRHAEAEQRAEAKTGPPIVWRPRWVATAAAAAAALVTASETNETGSQRSSCRIGGWIVSGA
jgi:hypothetical protein